MAKSQDALSQLFVRSTTGTPVPLSSLVKMSTRTAPLAINHQGQFAAVTVSFNLAPEASLGDAVTAIRATQDSIGMPPSIHAGFVGAADAFNESLASEPLLILAAILTVG